MLHIISFLGEICLSVGMIICSGSKSGTSTLVKLILPGSSFQTYNFVNSTESWKAIISFGTMEMELWGALTAIALRYDRLSASAGEFIY